jgi:tRNA modifying enzyme MnmG/GidA C-terminal helical bundle
VRTVIATDGCIRVCSAPQTSRSLRSPSGLHGGWDIPGLSHEIREKLTSIQPATLGQAARISGVTPAAVAILMVYFQKHRVQRASYGAELPETPLPGV